MGRIATAGLVLFGAATVGFVVSHELPLLDAAFLSALLALLPALAVAQVPLIAEAEIERASAYLGSGVTILVMGGVALVLGLRRGGPEALGLGPVAPATFALVLAALLAGAGLLMGGFHLLGDRLGWDEGPVLRQLLPRTGRERRLFAGLSVAAGFGEELAYRGFAVPVLAPILGGAWAAAAFTSLVFGVLHAYQGPVGIVRTASLGAMLAASLVLSGSLWPAIAAHVVVDLVGGLWLGERLLRG